MQYVSPFENKDHYSELMGDLSGLSIGSAFILNSPAHAEALLKKCDDTAKKVFDTMLESGLPAKVECITLETSGYVGFDSLRRTSDLKENMALCQVYRYFDTPRETIVTACIVAPSEMTKTKEITFFCGPDRRKAGDYRVFSIHPGKRRQPFPNRYQPEEVRRHNREYWDRHVFLSTPNQIIASSKVMRNRAKDLEQEARDRIFHLVRHIDAALHRWYGTWENMLKEGDFNTLTNNLQKIGDYGMDQMGSVYYFLSDPGQAPPDLNNKAETEPRLSNLIRPSIIHPDGGEEYFLNGRHHRENGPAVITPNADGGWQELWYEDGLISRLPEEGPAKIIYNENGTIVSEISIYKGEEVQDTTLGPAAEPVKALQAQIIKVLESFRWYEDSQDFQLLRGQLEFAANRSKDSIETVVRQMQQSSSQVGLRWDFDRTLEQDQDLKNGYNIATKEVKELEEKLVAAAQAMRFVQGNMAVITAIWNKVLRDMERVIEHGYRIPGEPGKTIIDEFAQATIEAKKFFKTLAEQNKIFSATGR